MKMRIEFSVLHNSEHAQTVVLIYLGALEVKMKVPANFTHRLEPGTA